jgi:hypothetical protein
VKKYTIGLPGIIIGGIISIFKDEPIYDMPNALSGDEDSNIIAVSLSEQKLISLIEGQVNLFTNVNEGYIILSVTMPEALAAAQLTQRVQELLQEYIIRFKIQKSSEELKYITERYLEKKNEFKSIQQQLAVYRDRNQNLSSAISQTGLEALKSEYNLVLGVYGELAKQLESHQLQVKKDTPIFTILKPVSVPLKKTKPNRPIIFIVWVFLGGICGIGFVLGKPIFIKGKNTVTQLT